MFPNSPSTFEQTPATNKLFSPTKEDEATIHSLADSFLQASSLHQFESELKALEFSKQVKLALQLCSKVYVIHCKSPKNTKSVLQSEEDIKIDLSNGEFEVSINDANFCHVNSSPQKTTSKEIGLKNDIQLLSTIITKLLTNATPEIFETYKIKHVLHLFLQKMQAKNPDTRPSMDNVIQFFNLLFEFSDQVKNDRLNELFAVKLHLVAHGCSDEMGLQLSQSRDLLKVLIQFSQYQLLSNGVLKLLFGHPLIPEYFSFFFSKGEYIDGILNLLFGQDVELEINPLDKQIAADILQTLIASAEDQNELEILQSKLNTAIRHNAYHIYRNREPYIRLFSFFEKDKEFCGVFKDIKNKIDEAIKELVATSIEKTEKTVKTYQKIWSFMGINR